ncbi:MAG: flagellar export chaperone FliS, partial [Bacillota bacterium]
MLAADLEQYRNVQVHTASGVNLIIMVLDSILKHLHLAETAIKMGEIENASKSIGKICDLLGELSGSLNFEAGDIATKLFSLYEYCGRRTTEALLRKD